MGREIKAENVDTKWQWRTATVLKGFSAPSTYSSALDFLAMSGQVESLNGRDSSTCYSLGERIDVGEILHHKSTNKETCLSVPCPLEDEKSLPNIC